MGALLLPNIWGLTLCVSVHTFVCTLTMNVTPYLNAQFECVDYICEGHLIDLCGLNVDRSP